MKWFNILLYTFATIVIINEIEKHESFIKYIASYITVICLIAIILGNILWCNKFYRILNTSFENTKLQYSNILNDISNFIGNRKINDFNIVFVGNLNFNSNIKYTYNDNWLYDLEHVSGWNNWTFATTYSGTEQKFIKEFLLCEINQLHDNSRINYEIIDTINQYPKNGYILQQDNILFIKLSEKTT